MLSKAKERPQQVKQVIDAVKAQGPVQTYRAVMKKLDAYSPLGYSCVGEIIGIGGHPGEMRSAVVNEFHRAGRSEVTPVEYPSVCSWPSNSTGQGGQRKENLVQNSEFKVGDIVACGGGNGESCGGDCGAGQFMCEIARIEAPVEYERQRHSTG